MDIGFKQKMEIKETNDIVWEEGSLDDEKKWVAVEDILKRLRDARVSKGYKDNYLNIENELVRLNKND